MGYLIKLPQFSLRNVLFAVSIVAIWLGIFTSRIATAYFASIISYFCVMLWIACTSQPSPTSLLSAVLIVSRVICGAISAGALFLGIAFYVGIADISLVEVLQWCLVCFGVSGFSLFNILSNERLARPDLLTDCIASHFRIIAGILVGMQVFYLWTCFLWYSVTLPVSVWDSNFIVRVLDSGGLPVEIALSVPIVNISTLVTLWTIGRRHREADSSRANKGVRNQ